jgi:hypothetical protein
MMLIRDQDGVRMSRGGNDWADRFALMVSAALKPP